MSANQASNSSAAPSTAPDASQQNDRQNSPKSWPFGTEKLPVAQPESPTAQPESPTAQQKPPTAQPEPPTPQPELSTAQPKPRSPSPEDSFPASYYLDNKDLDTSKTEIIERELDLTRIDAITPRLWMVGLMGPPRALHRQLALGRELVLTEQMDMHLVWETGKMYLKPLPSFLLDRKFWDDHLPCAGPHTCHRLDIAAASQSPMDFSSNEHISPECKRHKVATGFLYSYAALIQHESDLRVAQEKHLVPASMTWPVWRAIVAELVKGPKRPQGPKGPKGPQGPRIHQYIDYRFWYGELRLSRLNKLYYYWKTPGRNYMSRWNQYNSYLGESLVFVAATVAYVVVILTAMQVGLATDLLQDNRVFDDASGVFALVAILGPPAVIVGLIIQGVYWAVGNYSYTVRTREERRKCIVDKASA